jgi:hypothetical protein
MRDFAKDRATIVRIYRSELGPVPENCLRVGFGRSHVPKGLTALRNWLECVSQVGGAAAAIRGYAGPFEQSVNGFAGRIDQFPARNG